VVIDDKSILGETRPRIYGADGRELSWGDDGSISPAA
jgi:hypothetical protein